MCLVCSQLNGDVGVLCLCLRTRAAFLLVFGLFNVMWVVLNHAPGGSIGRVPLSSCHETSRRFLRYGNFFPSTFPEVLLAHASQMTGQLSQSMQIRRARDSINAMLATIISESFTSP